MMKVKLRMLYHTLRAGCHWHRMMVKLERSGLTHRSLLDVNRSYYKSSVKYNESINYLVSGGQYITARSLMKRRNYDAATE